MTTPESVLQWPLPSGEHGTPPPLYAKLRAECPVAQIRMPSGQLMWLLTRRDDIVQVASDPRFTRNLTYENAPNIAGEDINSVPGGLFNLDPPDHTRIRQLLQRFFTRSAVSTYRPMISDHAAALLSEMASGVNPTDLMSAYGIPLALRVNCDLLRIPPERRHAFHDKFRTQTNHSATPTEITDATSAINEFAAEIIAAKSDEPDPDEPIGALIVARRQKVISKAELYGTVSYLLVTGVEPVISPLATGTVTLLRHYGHLKLALDDPTLWPNAVEEILRYHHNGYLSNPRVALEDVKIHDVIIRAGEAVVTPFIAATWDPEHYPNPRKFDLHRSTDGSGTFGAGPHYCLGSALARTYLQVALSALFTTFPTLQLAVNIDELPWDENSLFTKPVILPVCW